VDFSPSRRRAPLVLELTPLIDVVFLLLIFFMVSTTFVNEPAGLQVELPRSENRDVIPDGTDVSVHLSADGRVFVEEEPVTGDEMRARLTAIALEDPTTMVVLRADESLEHGRVVEVMDLARDLGLRNFAIATEKQ
jgi:biopolymer transport protein ExbD